MAIKKFYILLLLFLFLFSATTIYAQNDLVVKDEKINPGTIYYSIKRSWEKLIEKLQFSDRSKFDFENSLLKTRLAELNFVVENNILNELETSTQRFSYQAGIVTERVVKLNDKKTNSQVLADFESDRKFLEKLKLKYTFNSSFWMLVTHSINSLDLYTEKLKK